MNSEILLRVCIGLAACVSLAWPFIKPHLDAVLRLSVASGGDSLANDAHTVMTIAIRLKAAGKTKSSEIARSLIDSILTE